MGNTTNTNGVKARFVSRDGRVAVLHDVRFDGPLVYGTTRHGRQLVLRKRDLTHQRVLFDDQRPRA